MNELHDNPMEEQHLKDLFKAFEPEKAPTGLQKKIMQQVMADWAAQPMQVHKTVFDWKKLWLGVGALVVIAGFLWYDVTLGHAYVESVGKSLHLGQMTHYADNLKKISDWFKSIPSLVVYVSLAAGVLLAFDTWVGKLKGA